MCNILREVDVVVSFESLRGSCCVCFENEIRYFPNAAVLGAEGAIFAVIQSLHFYHIAGSSVICYKWRKRDKSNLNIARCACSYHCFEQGMKRS